MLPEPQLSNSLEAGYSGRSYRGDTHTMQDVHSSEVEEYLCSHRVTGSTDSVSTVGRLLLHTFSWDQWCCEGGQINPF